MGKLSHFKKPDKLKKRSRENLSFHKQIFRSDKSPQQNDRLHLVPNTVPWSRRLVTSSENIVFYLGLQHQRER